VSSLAAPAPTFAKLNDVAWRGLAGRYRDVVSRCTEAPDVFHLGSFVAAVGCLIGRKAWVCCPHRVYPNFYSLLVGKTANARKTTAYQFSIDLFDEVQELLYDDHAKRLNGLASPEGLALAMKYRDSQEPYRILGIEDEFRSLITKGGQRAVANLIPKITGLFNSPRAFEVNTKNNPILVRNPFLCLLAASTRAWFEQSLTQRDVSGGFLNRWLLFEGQAEKELPTPPPVEQRPWENLVLEVADAFRTASGSSSFRQMLTSSITPSTMSLAGTSIRKLPPERTFTGASSGCCTRFWQTGRTISSTWKTSRPVRR
jgi:hypothetical protein